MIIRGFPLPKHSLLDVHWSVDLLFTLYELCMDYAVVGDVLGIEGGLPAARCKLVSEWMIVHYSTL